MGFRFRKSKNFGPLRINLSKTGVGWSVGTKGARYTKRADGKKQTTLSIPGTGISYVEVSGNNKDSSNTKENNISNNSFSNNNNYNNNNDDKPKVPFYKSSLFIWMLLLFLPPVGIILLWTSKKYNKKPRMAISVIFAFYTLFIIGSNASNPSPNNSIAKNNTSITQESNKNSNKDKLAAEEAEKQKAAQEEAEKQKVAEEKAAAEKVAQEEAEKKRIAEEKAAAEEAEKQRIAQEQAAAEEAERQRIAQEQAAVAQVQTQTVPEVQQSQNIGQTVYIASSGNGKKYHSNPNCSNMNGTIQLSVDEALNRGYTACKKCY